MPKLKKSTERKRAQDKVLAFLAEQGVDTTEIQEPLETEEEKLLEAQAVVNYFERNGEGFRYETCSNCGLQFAYDYHYNGIKSCSIRCMSDNLQKLGLSWTYGKDLIQRWGDFYPAIVPGIVLARQNGIEDQESSESPSYGGNGDLSQLYLQESLLSLDGLEQIPNTQP